MGKRTAPFTAADLGYDDPELLRQLNMNWWTYDVAGGTGSGKPPGAGPGYGEITDPPIGGTTMTTLDANGNPTFSFPTSAGGLANQGCDLLPTQILRDICKGVVTSATGGNGTTATAQPCPKGYHRGANGGCVIDGPGSYLPGDVGKPDYVWTPQYGRYGAGVTPVLVQMNRRACPAGMVVGKDGLCYDHLARTNRLHNPGAKPMLTGGDMNALRTAHRLQKQIGKIARRFGPKKAKVQLVKGKK